MNQETIDKINGMLSQIKQVRTSARLFAASNPMGFIVVMGCNFPAYDETLRKLENVLIKARDYGKDHSDAGSNTAQTTR